MSSSTSLPNGTGTPTPTPTRQPQITLYFLQCSRSIRIAWLLEELGLPYEVKFYERDKKSLGGVGIATAGAGTGTGASFEKESGGTMGKAPVLVDGELVVQESGAITEYLLDKYDTLNQLLPLSPSSRTKCQTYIHAAEGTFLLHGLVPFYISLASASAASELHPQLVEAAGKDMEWLESELEKANGRSRYLVGDSVTAADTMMEFSVQFLLRFGLVPKGKKWPCVARWLENVESNKVGIGVSARSGEDGA